MKKQNITSNKIIKKLEEKKESIKKYHVKKIGVFGSFIKNKQNKNSDIDILVEFENVDFDTYMDLKFLLEDLFNRKVDLVIEKDLREELKYVKKEAKYVEL